MPAQWAEEKIPVEEQIPKLAPLRDAETCSQPGPPQGLINYFIHSLCA
jgi:hypothetical protein